VRGKVDPARYGQYRENFHDMVQKLLGAIAPSKNARFWHHENLAASPPVIQLVRNKHQYLHILE